MSRREAWLSALGIFALALAVRAGAARTVPFPVPEDTAYYVSVARNLVQGRGLVSDALWSYQTPPLEFPRPAFEVWLPLPTFLMAVPMALFGATPASAQVASVVVSALVPVLAWRIAADVADELDLPVGRARTLAVGSGVVASIYGSLVLYGALPDSTATFTVLALGACLVMVRLLRRPPSGWRDARLLGLGFLIGLAALARNEALWVGLVWAWLAWRWIAGSGTDRLRLIVAPAVVAILIYLPWAIRDWAVFGNPLPGQAAANALSVTGSDIFAWQDPPTVTRYLAQGIGSLATMRVDGFVHNLVTVLLVPAFPIGPIGLVALPWAGRARALRPLLVLSLLTFWVTTLVFPVATTWGTFLHAAGPVHVLLLVSCLVALDGALARIGRFRGWTRPTAWLGPALAAGIAFPILVLTMSSIGSLARDTQARYAALPEALAAAGVPLEAKGAVVTDFPIWYATALQRPALALPEESPASVLSLAHRFDAGLVIVQDDGTRHLPGELAAGAPGATCFREVPLPVASGSPLAKTRVYEVVCP